MHFVVANRSCISLCALDEVPLLDDRRPLDLFRLDGGYGLLLMVVRPQVSVHVFVVFVFVHAWSAVHLVRVVGLFHHAVRVTVVVIRSLIIGTGPLFGHVVLTARIRWPARSSLPMGPEIRGRDGQREREKKTNINIHRQY